MSTTILAKDQPEGDSSVVNTSVDVLGAAPKRLRRTQRLVHRVAMRPRRIIVKAHRWLSIVLLAWLVVISVTGAWLAVHHSVESWIHADRYSTTPGDIGLQAATDAALAAAGADSATVRYAMMPRTARGVYQVELTVPVDDAASIEPGGEPVLEYPKYFVDPGSGRINGVITKTRA
jgi:uncharacterized iron-regulated membrane protein